MMYLNGDFDGGSTNWVDECQSLFKVTFFLPVFYSFDSHGFHYFRTRKRVSSAQKRKILLGG